MKKGFDKINTKNKVNVIKELKRIKSIVWFRPQKIPNKVKLQLKINSILSAFKLDFKTEIQLHVLDSPSAWTSTRASAWDSAWDSAWASARASAWEVVDDLMKKKGYKENPYKLLMDLWEMGLYPIGVLKDKKFHIYYVPLKKAKK